MTHLLVTNDYPPKVGGIQNYLWELWRRLPPDEFTVFTRPHPGDCEWDSGEEYRIVRSRQSFLLPTPALCRTVDDLADEIGASLVVFDPAVPVGAIGPSLRHRYSVILHGAEVTVPGRIPIARSVLARTIRESSLIISASGYAEVEAERASGVLPPSVSVPPGVDVNRFRPLSPLDAMAARRRLGLPTDVQLVLGQSRVVPRKGFDVLIGAVDRVNKAFDTPVELVLGGTGRDEPRLRRIAAAADVPVRFLGHVADHDLADLFGCVDLFAMLCRSRWGGLEQEGFGIVFLEAAAAGTPQIAGNSGGAAEAVADGVSGLIVDDPTDEYAVAAAIAKVLTDPAMGRSMAIAGRRRAVDEFSYDLLAERLLEALKQFDLDPETARS